MDALTYLQIGGVLGTVTTAAAIGYAYSRSGIIELLKTELSTYKEKCTRLEQKNHDDIQLTNVLKLEVAELKMKTDIGPFKTLQEDSWKQVSCILSNVAATLIKLNNGQNELIRLHKSTIVPTKKGKAIKTIVEPTA